MKKIIPLILLLVLLVNLPGCSAEKERGEINEAEQQEVYYYKTTYVQQPFVVLFDVEDPQGRTVTFATTDNPDYSQGFYSTVLEPNTLFKQNFSTEDYNKYIGGLPVFEGTFTAYTFVFPNGEKTKYCTVIEFEDNLAAAVRDAQKAEGDILPFSEEYLKKWKFLWYKI